MWQDDCRKGTESCIDEIDFRQIVYGQKERYGCVNGIVQA